MSRASRPTPAQELLLRAALLDETRAQAAWAVWGLESADSPLDEASSRLLPLLHRRLAPPHPMLETPSLEKLVAIRARAASAPEQTRYRNALLFEEAAASLKVLMEAGIRTCLLKGAALTLAAYADPAPRPMSDVDVLIPRWDLERAAEVLARAGWRTPSLLGAAETALAHAVAFTNETRGSIDAHWRSLDAMASPEGDASLWAGAGEAVFEGEPTRIPAPADLLFHACVVGQRTGRDVACRWVADAFVVLTTSHRDMDWARRESEARRQAESAAVADALGYDKRPFAGFTLRWTRAAMPPVQRLGPSSPL